MYKKLKKARQFTKKNEKKLTKYLQITKNRLFLEACDVGFNRLVKVCASFVRSFEETKKKQTKIQSETEINIFLISYRNEDFHYIV